MSEVCEFRKTVLKRIQVMGGDTIRVSYKMQVRDFRRQTHDPGLQVAEIRTQAAALHYGIQHKIQKNLPSAHRSDRAT